MNCKVHANEIEEVFEFNKVAKQADGSLLYKINDTVILATAVMEDEPIEEEFLPLTVQYIEKAYAARKIPGGFIKRETKPGDFETLTSRIVDRSIRPLFPDGFFYPVQVTIMVLSADNKTDLQVAALNAASAALYTSSIPVDTPIYAARVGRVDENFVLNTDEESGLDLFVAGTKDDLLMIEMKANKTVDFVETTDAIVEPAMSTVAVQNNNAVDEQMLVEAIDYAKDAVAGGCREYKNAFEGFIKTPKKVKLSGKKVDEGIFDYVKSHHAGDVAAALQQMAKSERASGLSRLAKQIAEQNSWDEALVAKVLDVYKKEVIRDMVLNKEKRVDGRSLDEVRPISIETNILPNAHGSCLFTRGQTQALAVTTLGGDKDSQMYELLTESETQNENFMVHYNFPGFSVGEASRIGPPGRRELGHGNLAKRALESSLKTSETVRLVSEILESNGSSSMATVCAGSLALKATDIDSIDLVAGVAMGLVSDGTRNKVITDIMGLEDANGDMDFKVAGTKEGITAMQMDIKLGGIDTAVLKDALLQAKTARMHILELMEAAAKQIELNEKVLPSVEHFPIDPAAVASVIGKAGSTIKKIIEKFDVSIDLDRDSGNVKVAGEDKDSVSEAKSYIQKLAGSDTPPKFEEGKTYTGTVKKVVDFGAFIEIEGYEALLHISKIAKGRVNDVHDYFTEGEDIDVVVLGQKGKKVELATKEYVN
ncbi:MAG: polyribonucleotide nucleotidyltransferase [Campylobacterota bacterium]